MIQQQQYIVLDIFGGSGYMYICSDKDGQHKFFNTVKEAEKYGKDNAQMPLVVKLPSDFPIAWAL